MKRTRNFLQLVTFYCCEIHKTNPLLSDSSFSDRTRLFVCLFFPFSPTGHGCFFFFVAFFQRLSAWQEDEQCVAEDNLSFPSRHTEKKNHMRSASICHGGRACYTPHAQADNLWRRKRDVQVIIWSWEMYLERIRAAKNKITSLQCANVESRIFLTVFRNQLRLSITLACIWFITKRKQNPTKNTVKIRTISVLFYSAQNIRSFPAAADRLSSCNDRK